VRTISHPKSPATATETFGGAPITFTVPQAGSHPSEFRREFFTALRDAIAVAAMAGRLDFARADECFRALSIQEPRQ
jgi:hypothetical protein